jgi:DNA-binding NarL/FixJ family response regulator
MGDKLTRPRVLCIEDSSYAFSLSSVLTLEGFEVNSCTKEELPSMLATEVDVCIVRSIEDIDLIRKEAPHIPTICFSETSTAETRRSSIEAGASAYLINPIDFDKLPLTVRRLMRQPHYGLPSMQRYASGNRLQFQRA